MTTLSSRSSLSLTTLAGGVLLAALLAPACSSSSSGATPEDPAGSCSAIAKACHSYDDKSALGHECHELGHAGDDSKCIGRKAECLAGCPTVDGGDHHQTDAGTDAATADAADADAGPSLCTLYCQCLAGACGAQTGYPYADQAACEAGCAALDAPSKECFPKWCAKAEASSSKGHLCEHAWGGHGTDECDTL